MNSIIVNLYQLYKRKGDPNPEMKITGYLTLVLYLATWCSVILSIEIISLKFYNNNLKPHSVTFIFGSLLSWYFYYKQVFKVLFKSGRMKALEEKYKATHIPASLLYFIVIFAPIFLLTFGAALTVFLTGGGDTWDQDKRTD